MYLIFGLSHNTNLSYVVCRRKQ